MLSQQLTAQLYWLTITIPFGPSIPYQPCTICTFTLKSKLAVASVWVYPQLNPFMNYTQTSISLWLS